MYTLFNDPPLSSRGNMVIPDYLYVKGGLARNLESAISYYQQNPKAVKSNHFLVRLLQNISVPFGSSVNVYRDRVADMALTLAMSLKMTSPIYSGHVFDGVFYGAGVTEILIADDSYFDTTGIESNWRSLEPIKVLSHPKSDLSMDIPDGISAGDGYGLAVLVINIPMLACQYREFRKEEERLGITDTQSVMQFLHMYPLTNLLRSHIDVSVFNRFCNSVKGVTNSSSVRNSTSYYTDYSQKLDRVHTCLAILILGKKLDFDSILLNIPLVTLDNARELLKFPNLTATRQVEWALAITRIQAISTLVQLNSKSGSSQNQKHLNKIKRTLIEMSRDKTMEHALPRLLNNEVVDSINREIVAYL